MSLRIKTLAVGYNGRGRFYHIGGFKGARWYNKQLDKIRSRRDRCKKKSRRYIHLSGGLSARLGTEAEQTQRLVSTKQVTSWPTNSLESTVVVGDVS